MVARGEPAERSWERTKSRGQVEALEKDSSKSGGWREGVEAEMGGEEKGKVAARPEWMVLIS